MKSIGISTIKLCEPCEASLGTHEKEVRQWVWNELTAAFQLLTWEQLKQQEVTDLGYDPDNVGVTVSFRIHTAHEHRLLTLLCIPV